MENIVPRWLTEADCWCVGGSHKVPECWPVNSGKLFWKNSGKLEPYIQIIQANLDQKKFLVFFWLWAALRLQVLCSSFMIFPSSHYHPHNTRLLAERLNAGVGGPTKPKVALFGDSRSVFQHYVFHHYSHHHLPRIGWRQKQGED